MPESIEGSPRGIHRFRTIFFSEEGRLAPCEDAADAERLAKLRLRECVRHQRAASFLIADCRLLERENPLVAMLPPELRSRLRGFPGLDRLPMESDGGLSSAKRANFRRYFRMMLPWLAGMGAAAGGFWVFLQRNI